MLISGGRSGGSGGLLVVLLGLCVFHSPLVVSEDGKLIKAGDYEVSAAAAEPVMQEESLVRVKRDASKHFEASTYECGSRRSCYVSLKTCDVDPRTCNYVLSWDYDSENVNFELSALTHAWISVVLSDDQYYGDDNIIVCSRHPDTGVLSIDHYYKRRDDADLIHLKPEDALVKKSIDYNQADGYLTCKFSRAKTVDNRYVTDLAKPHFIHIERGAPGELVFDKLRSFQPSETRVEFANTVHVPVSPRSWLVKVHAVLAIIAWILLGSLGIIIARYYKPMWPSRMLNTYRVWFTLHRSLMIFVLILTLVSFVFALIELDWQWSVSGHDYLHAILGLIVIVCTCLNPILGMCRPKPDSKRRCLFFWFHWFIGCVAYCLAVPTIFIGMDLSKSDIPNWCAWLLFAWVIFHIIVEIILEIHYCCTYSQSKHNYHESNIEYDELSQKNNTNKTVVTVKKRNPPGYRWKPTLLFFYALVTTIVVGVLIVAIVLLDA